MRQVLSWGRTLICPHHTHLSGSVGANYPLLNQSPTGLAYGNGRSYGDVCLNPGQTLWMMRGLDHLINFDAETGVLRCEAGVLLSEIQDIMVPQGWMLPVTPGTQLITVGGAIANDVHGKNHHVFGSFGDHVQQLILQRTDGTRITCSDNENADWLAATIGGFGLTGVIEQVDIRLRKIAGPWLQAENHAYQNLEGFFSLSDQSEADWEHTVSWIDCMSGRQAKGVFMRANHSPDKTPSPEQKQPKSVPFVPPISCINALSLKPFNALYYRLQASKKQVQTLHYRPFFYPLDNLHEWNRIYGPQGFYQYQSVVPRENGSDATKKMLDAIKKSGQGSFLAVLKTFGNQQPKGLMSFPMPGVTLALDFPNKGTDTFALFDRLDAIVREAQGRLYLAKDGRMPRDLFEAGYPNLQTFLKYRDTGISSSLSRRLIGS